MQIKYKHIRLSVLMQTKVLHVTLMYGKVNFEVYRGSPKCLTQYRYLLSDNMLQATALNGRISHGNYELSFTLEQR